MGIKQYLKDHALAIGYIATLAIGFGTGIYIGSQHNKDITYAICKAEKEACNVDRNLKKWTPRVAAKVVDAVEDLQREAIWDMNEQEAEKKYKERTEHLDKIINDYESK
ncbi:hypothetical protein KY333_01680 [Candidatus Woesearchaeota archaeon]|nr:hypothetical protein [Candidatus Woesearchaeota archaeon]MBW2994521.1 hypothetical protein [Candidatus Woesearchaeota archaeon]